MNQRKVRVRFAPSPTGPLHIGGVRTALYNYLFAKKHNGDFLLRIEDTDQTRFVQGAEAYIVESLEWCGIKVDEGVKQGGAFAPYRQSERKAIYKKYAQILVDNGNAYYAFDTPEELDKYRKEAEEKKTPFVYNSVRRKTLKNSLNMSAEEVNKRLENKENYVIRFKVPENEDLLLKDIIRGEIRVNTATLDDKVLFKADGLPTYHLANIVDDYLMKISHVIRGEEWLPSLPLHVLLYRAFAWENDMPEFAHLPLLLKPEGNGKLSKRDGDKLGFPVFPLRWTAPNGETAIGYREEGYFPEAFVNLLALLGWSSGTEQELFSMQELIQEFSLSRVNKSGAKFDPKKAQWFNHQYLIKKENSNLCQEFMPILEQKGIQADKLFVEQIIALIKERASFVKDFWEQSWFFFQSPISYDEKVVKKRWKEDTPKQMLDIKTILGEIAHFDAETVKKHVAAYIETNALSFGAIMNALRLCLVGGGVGPDLFQIIEKIGKTASIERIENALSCLNKK